MTPRPATPVGPLRIVGLSFRIQRFEWVIVVGATVLSVLVSALVSAWIRAAGFDRCLTDEAASLSVKCQTGVVVWLYRVAEMSMNLVPIFPVVAGLLVGGPIVARELESGTARLAWSLGPSRLRWFIHRALPAMVVVTVAGLAIGATSDALLHLVRPDVDIDQTFAGFRARGMLVAVDALVVASIALALGSIIGRAVPTLVLSLVLIGALTVAVEKVESQLLTSEAQSKTNYSFNGNDLYIASRIQNDDGRIITYDELYAIHPEFNENGYNPDQYPDVTLYIPGSRYHDVERREAAALLAIAGLFIVLAAGTVVRRRPR
jgi:hypothetical protein